MSLVLSTKQKLFIQRMTENDEQAKWGFEILLKRHDFNKFFDHLEDAKLFSPEHNLGPVSSEDPGYVRIPYWSALDYLKAVAGLAGENEDIQLAQKVTRVIYSVSTYRDPAGSTRDNYQTYRKFAEILGLLPTAALTTEDLDLIPIWLSSKYDHGMVGHALDLGILRRLLASNLPDDWKKACIILRHCTAIVWIDKRGLGKGRLEPISVVEDYWLKKLIENHASTFGIKAGGEAAAIFLDRVHEVFGAKFGEIPTYLCRPAVEDHPQNHSGEGIVNCVVEGLRDVLLSWVDHDPEDGRRCVAEMLVDDNEMVRRIGIYVLGQRWSVLKNLYNNIISPELFSSRHVHELYHLLKECFGDFREPEKAATIDAIRLLPPSQNREDDDQYLRYTQRNWLSAIAGKGYEPADAWFKELTLNEALGPLSNHPDFHSYMETWSGPEPSPYSEQELLAFAEDGSLIERLNDFQQPDVWHGPSTTALVDTLERTVAIDPQRFLRLLPTFCNAKRPYQYGTINGFKRLWDAPKEKPLNFDWNVAWEALISFFGQLLSNPDFWTEEIVQYRDLTPTRDWIPPIIAEFLRGGTKDDDKAYPSELLSHGFSLIKMLLENLECVDEVQDDAMFQAINSSKGKTIEALFSHTLRVCRLSDKRLGDHVEVWNDIKATFDAELDKCKNTNYEFSTLVACYLAHIDYVNRDWLLASMDKIFPQDYPANFVCAIDGLTYASATRSIYALLNRHGVLDKALRLELNRRQVRERIVERIALGYLWGDEQLDSPRFSYLFESARCEDLENASRFFRSVNGPELNRDQIERILSFWEKCVSWAQSLAEPPKSLLSELSQLICYVTTLESREANLLLAVAEYVGVGYKVDTFIEGLDRLVEQDPAIVSRVLGKVLETYEPDYDYEDRLKKLLTKLAERGRQDDVLLYADRMRKLPGFDQLFRKFGRV